MKSKRAWIAYKLHHDGSLGIVDCQGQPGYRAVEAIQAEARKNGRPDGITWKAADDIVNALIACAEL